MTLYKEMISRDVKFATLDSSQHLVTIFELDERGFISKSVNQEIVPKRQEQSASTTDLTRVESGGSAPFPNCFVSILPRLSPSSIRGNSSLK